jgi:hypothetical protein
VISYSYDFLSEAGNGGKPMERRKQVRRVTLSKPLYVEPSVKPETSSFSSHDGVEAN